MPDLGSPSSYLLLQPGVPVWSSDDAEVGTVREVLAAPDDDIFDGILVHTKHGTKYVEAAEVAEIYEHGVALTVCGVVVDALPERR